MKEVRTIIFDFVKVIALGLEIKFRGRKGGRKVLTLDPQARDWRAGTGVSC